MAALQLLLLLGWGCSCRCRRREYSGSIAAVVTAGGVHAYVGGENTVPGSQMLLPLGMFADVGRENTVPALQLLLLLGVFVQTLVERIQC